MRFESCHLLNTSQQKRPLEKGMIQKKGQLIVEQRRFASVLNTDRALTSQTCLKHMVNQQLIQVNNYCDYYNYYFISSL